MNHDPVEPEYDALELSPGEMSPAESRSEIRRLRAEVAHLQSRLAEQPKPLPNPVGWLSAGGQFSPKSAWSGDAVRVALAPAARDDKPIAWFVGEPCTNGMSFKDVAEGLFFSTEVVVSEEKLERHRGNGNSIWPLFALPEGSGVNTSWHLEVFLRKDIVSSEFLTEPPTEERLANLRKAQYGYRLALLVAEEVTLVASTAPDIAPPDALPEGGN